MEQKCSKRWRSTEPCSSPQSRMGNPCPTSHDKFWANSARIKYLSAFAKQTALYLNHSGRWQCLEFLTKLCLAKLQKSPLKKSTHFSIVSAPLYAWWQNWIQFKKHLSDLSAVSSTLLLFGYAARRFQHVFTKSRRCHLDTAKQNLATHSAKSDRHYNLVGDRDWGCSWDYHAQCWVPPQGNNMVTRQPIAISRSELWDPVLAPCIATTLTDCIPFVQER